MHPGHEATEATEAPVECAWPQTGVGGSGWTNHPPSPAAPSLLLVSRLADARAADGGEDETDNRVDNPVPDEG